MWHEVDDALEASFEHGTKEHRRDAGRSREEVERLTVNENLGDLERACLFLAANAHPLQQSCAIGKLHTNLKEYGGKAHETIFPILTASLDGYSEACQIQAADALTAMLHDESLAKEAPDWFFPTVFHMIKSHRSPDVMHAWLGTMRALVPLVPQLMLTEDLLQLAMAKAQEEETKQAHAVSCNIFGAIAPLLDGKLITQTYLHKAMALCQDTATEVRACMCENLDPISRSVGLNTFMISVFPELNELLKDEESVVQAAAVESLVRLLDFLPPDIRQAQVLPFLRSLCEEESAAMHVTLARLIGDIIVKMVPELLDDDTMLLLDAYKELAQHPNEEVRQLCAYNFPAVLKTIGSRKYATLLHGTYIHYVQDTSPAVRCTAAACFHEVAKILGKERAAQYLKESFYSLLKDPSLVVQSKLFHILPTIIGHFSVSNAQQKAATYAAMIPALVQADESVNNTTQWRMQRCFLQAFTILPEYFTSDQIYDNFVPICFRYMSDGVLPVKISAALALAVFLRNNCRTHQRHEMSQRVVNEYGQGQSYWSRLLYIDFCESLLRVASSRMFKESFLDSAINALQDPVPSIRMRACQIINSLRTVVRKPEDVVLLERINYLATQRLNDSNPDVAAAAHLASDNQKRVFILDMMDEYEKMDRHRKEEEWNMLNKDEQEEKRRLDESSQRLKIESLRKSSADITGRSSIGATSTSDSSSSKKGSTSKGSVNGASLKGVPRSGSVVVRSKSQLLSSSPIPPGSGVAPAAALPASGSSNSAHRSSLPPSQKLRSPSPAGPARNNPVADGAPSEDQTVPRRNSNSAKR